MHTNGRSPQAARQTLPAASAHHPFESLDSLAVTTRFHRGQEICAQSRPAEHWYCLISGVARRYALRVDGRRQIFDLLLPGDFFGFTVQDVYDFSVEAVAEGTMAVGYPRRRAEKIADADPRLARELREVTFSAIARLQAQILIVGRVTVVEKVGSFLLDMAARTEKGSADRIVLPVSRYDIADYLAVSVETVSRSLTDLKHRGLITLAGTRTIKILDRDALEDAERLHRAA